MNKSIEICFFDLFVVEYRRKICSKCNIKQKKKRNAIIGVFDEKCYCDYLNKVCNIKLNRKFPLYKEFQKKVNQLKENAFEKFKE